LVRRDLGPVRRISPALRQNFIRSSRNHQLEPGVTRKNLSPERRVVTPAPPFTQVRCRNGPVSGHRRDHPRHRYRQRPLRRPPRRPAPRVPARMSVRGSAAPPGTRARLLSAIDARLAA
jgi:hypothetical protein